MVSEKKKNMTVYNVASIRFVCPCTNENGTNIDFNLCVVLQEQSE